MSTSCGSGKPSRRPTFVIADIANCPGLFSEIVLNVIWV